jgi:hypothetical protein
MTKKKLMDPNYPPLKEGQRIATLMEVEMRKQKPDIETRIYAVVATAAVNCAMLAETNDKAIELLETIMDTARGAIPSIMAAKNTANSRYSR